MVVPVTVNGVPVAYEDPLRGVAARTMHEGVDRGDAAGAGIQRRPHGPHGLPRLYTVDMAGPTAVHAAGRDSGA